MTIVINGRFLNQPVTGVQRYGRAFLEHLDAMPDKWGHHTFSVICPKLSRSQPQLRNIEIVQRGKLKSHLWEQLELPCYLDGSLLLCFANTAPVLSLFSGKRIVTVVHSLAYACFPESYSPIFRATYSVITPLIMRYSSVVITVSETEKKSILRRYPNVEKRLFVVPNGGLPYHIAPKETSPCAGPYILYVGTFNKLKNFPAVLKVAERILTKHRDFFFVFIGDTGAIYNEAIFRRDEKLSTRMLFPGQIDDFGLMAQYYKHATALVFPSQSESSGLPPIEAMSFGCPVIVSDIPALRERCGDAAIYCEPCVHDIFEKTDIVIRDHNLRVDLAERGLQHATQFTWDNCVLNTLNILHSIDG
ncbi:MAG: glycosyltransferase family 1 protein [Methylocella sp.]